MDNSDPHPVCIYLDGARSGASSKLLYAISAAPQATPIVVGISRLRKLCLQTVISYFLNTLTFTQNLDYLRFIFTNKEIKAGKTKYAKDPGEIEMPLSILG